MLVGITSNWDIAQTQRLHSQIIVSFYSIPHALSRYQRAPSFLIASPDIEFDPSLSQRFQSYRQSNCFLHCSRSQQDTICDSGEMDQKQANYERISPLILGELIKSPTWYWWVGQMGELLQRLSISLILGELNQIFKAIVIIIMDIKRQNPPNQLT